MVTLPPLEVTVLEAESVVALSSEARGSAVSSESPFGAVDVLDMAIFATGVGEDKLA